MSYFKAKIQQNPFRLGLRPRPRWRCLQRSIEPLAGFKGATSKRKEGREIEGIRKEPKGREKRGKWRGSGVRREST